MPNLGGENDSIEPVPEANTPGHHPKHEQDKPIEAFAAKAQAMSEKSRRRRSAPQAAGPDGGGRAKAGGATDQRAGSRDQRAKSSPAVDAAKRTSTGQRRRPASAAGTPPMAQVESDRHPARPAGAAPPMAQVESDRHPAGDARTPGGGRAQRDLLTPVGEQTQPDRTQRERVQNNAPLPMGNRPAPDPAPTISESFERRLPWWPGGVPIEAAFPVLAVADALTHSGSDWEEIGESRTAWLARVTLLPVVGAWRYSTSVRPRLVAAERAHWLRGA